MQRTVTLLAILAIVAFPFSASAAPDRMFVSAPGEQGPKSCDHFHHEESCDRYHIIVEKSVGNLGPGSRVLLEGQRFEVEWSGTGYRLDDGRVVTANGAGTWQQVWPTYAPVSVSDWTDLDGTAHLTVSDTLSIDGMSSVVTEVHFYAWLNRVD